MAKKISDRINELLQNMDPIDYIEVIRTVQKEIGDRKMLNVLEAVSASKSSFDESEISRWAANCTDMDEREWYRIATDDGYGGYIDPGENACEVMLENLREEFEKDLEQMVLVGKKDEASRFLRAIAEGFRNGHGILADEAEDFLIDFADHLEERADAQDFKDVFQW